MNESLLGATEAYVRSFFGEHLPVTHHFHNLDHTVGVVQAAEKIAAEQNLPAEDLEILLLSAWFHDTGYSRLYEGHESASVEIATVFLKEQGQHAVLIDKVADTIMATKMPQLPKTPVAEILCDADLLHLGTEHFEEENRLLRKELIETHGHKIGKKTWRLQTISLLQNHKYFTAFAQKFAQPGKEKNMQLLLDKNERDEAEAIATTENTPKQKKPKQKNKQLNTERGVATMFRIMSSKHISISQMADSKANIMISLNTIVLSIIVSALLGKLQLYPQFIIPTILLVAICLCAVVYAIMVTRPNVNHGMFTQEDLQQKKVNLLFFGNFFNMDVADYENGMVQMMKDNEFLYGSMIKDIYYHGKVLARKYKYLRLSYNIFMYGLIFSMVAFGIAAFAGKN
jgi:predicted metal-dependent HD superfamily phosphohydrolase